LELFYNLVVYNYDANYHYLEIPIGKKRPVGYGMSLLYNLNSVTNQLITGGQILEFSEAKSIFVDR